MRNHRDSEGGKQLERLPFIEAPASGQVGGPFGGCRSGAGAGRAPGEVRRERVGAGFRRAKGGDSALGEQGERAFRVGSQENRERLRVPLRAHDGVDRELRVELRRRPDHRQDAVALRGREQIVERGGVPLRGRRHREIDDRRFGVRRDRLDAERAQAVDDARGAAPGGGHDRDARGARQVRRHASRKERCDLDERLELIHAHDSAVAEIGVEGRVLAC